MDHSNRSSAGSNGQFDARQFAHVPHGPLVCGLPDYGGEPLCPACAIAARQRATEAVRRDAGRAVILLTFQFVTAGLDWRGAAA